MEPLSSGEQESEMSGPLTPAEQARFDRASAHPYECKCDDCQFWWENVPPEDEEEDDYDDDEPAF